jgi:hypothetical protein
VIGFVFIAIVSAAPASHVAQGYDRPHRVAYLKAALAAVRETRPDRLAQEYEYATALDRGACSVPTPRLRAECLVAAARRFCKEQGGSCALTMDVIASNVLAETQLVPPETRYELMKEYPDYRREVARRIWRLQGTLAVDFRLRSGGPTGGESLEDRIDTFCVASADKSNLPWQTCAASLVWFIATAPAVPGGHS